MVATVSLVMRAVRVAVDEVVVHIEETVTLVEQAVHKVFTVGKEEVTSLKKSF